MRQIETVHAVGHVLCHDLTRIVPGEWKGAQFRKGHVVTEEDIPMLLSMGKDHLYVWEMDENHLHENDAALRLGALCRNDWMQAGEIREGKLELTATRDGLFTVDTQRLNAINSLEEIIIATRHTHTAVKAGDKLCGTRVIPLVIETNQIEEAERIGAGKPLLTLTPYKPMAGGIRDEMLFKDFHLLWGSVALLVVVLIGNLILGKFKLGFTDQPIAHTDGLWNFLGMRTTDNHFLFTICFLLIKKDFLDW